DSQPLETVRHSSTMNRRNLRILAAVLMSSALLAPASPALRAQPMTGFEGYLQQVAARARSEGVSEATISQVTAGLTENPRVVELDRDQPGNRPTPPPLAPYLRRHVDAQRIAGGRSLYGQVTGILPQIERTYGVPGKM